MFIKDGKLYFKSNDCLNINNLIFDSVILINFTLKKLNNRNISSNKNKLLVNLNISTEYNKYTICVNLFDAHINSYKDGSITEIPNNKKSLLIYINNELNKIYSNLLILKKNNIKTYFKNINLYNAENLDKNLIRIKANNINIYTLNNNYNDTIIIQCLYESFDKYFKNCVFEIHDNKVVINIFNDCFILYFPQIFERNFKRNTNSEFYINFGLHADKYISKSYENIYIHPTVPQHLIFFFIDNINIFKDIKELNIENEYDLLKFL